jgi:hypothetical protein
MGGTNPKIGAVAIQIVWQVTMLYDIDFAQDKLYLQTHQTMEVYK